MSKLLLDSSLIIDLLRQKDKKQSLLYKFVQQGCSFYLSIITYAELYSGKSIWEHRKTRSELEIVLQGMEILPLNKDISKNAGQIRAKYGTNLLDAIIAATAIIHKLDLATLNIKDFETIDGIKYIQSSE